MKSVVRFNKLDGRTVSRRSLVRIVRLAEKEKQVHVMRKLNKLLDSHPDAQMFDLSIKEKLQPESRGFLAAPDDFNPVSLGIPELTQDVEDQMGDHGMGLGKPVTSNDIYDMVTNQILDMIEKEGDLVWYNGRDQKGADDSVFLPIPMNFKTKKVYRGINAFLLGFYPKRTEKSGKEVIKHEQIKDEKLFWLTINQIESSGGKLKKGSKAAQAIYYNWIYKNGDKTISEKEYRSLWKKLSCGVKEKADKACDELLKIPFLRYYNVFNERDIEGIDFESVRKGMKSKAKHFESKQEKIAAAEAIIKNMPNAPQIIEKLIEKPESPNYQPLRDLVVMPQKEQYSNVAIWYGTAFHELVHSTGHVSRIGRVGVTDFDGFGSPKYAFEELIAELGSAFLNSESGIFFQTIKKNAAYIKGWKKAVVAILKEDNKAIFKAAGAAQKAADYILVRDQNGNPKFYTDIQVKSSDLPFDKSDIPYDLAYRAHSGTSHVPEKRAEGEQAMYFSSLMELYERYQSYAKKEGTEGLFKSAFEKFQKGYLKRKITELERRSRVLSTMITGAANFPTKRNQRASSSYESAAKDTWSYLEYAEKRMRETLTAKVNKPTKLGSDGALEVLQEKLKKAKEAHDRNKAGNKVISPILKKDISDKEKLEQIGEALLMVGFAKKEVDEMISMISRYGFMYAKFGTTNSLAKVKRLQSQVDVQKRLLDTPSKEFNFGGGTILYNTEENKVQIYFDDVPSVDIRDTLKKYPYSFKWSPKNKAWQRQLNTFSKQKGMELLKWLRDFFGYHPDGDGEKKSEETLKKRVDREPEGIVINPKSVSVQTAINDVLSLKKYSGLKSRQATLLYRIFRDDPELEYQTDKPYEIGILKSIDERFALVDVWNFSEADIVLNDNLGADFVNAVSGRLETLRNAKYNYSLFGGLEINTDKFKEMNVRGLRKLTLEYYNKYLKGNKTAIKDHLKEVVFTSAAGRKIAKGGAMYKEKAAVVEFFEQVIKNSTYNNWGDRKPKDKSTVLGYLNFKSKLIIDGVKRHVRISVELHKDRRAVLKNYDVGNKKSDLLSSGRNTLPADGESKPQDKYTKNSNTPKKSLGTIVLDVDAPMQEHVNGVSENKGMPPTPIYQQEIAQSAPQNKEIELGISKTVQNISKTVQKIPENASKYPKTVKNSKVRNIGEGSIRNSEYYTVSGAVGDFLQAVERKPSESVVITIDGEQGAGKTTMLYQFMDAFALPGNHCLFLSGEEHPDSALAIQKVDKYLSEQAKANIDILDEVESLKELSDLIQGYEVIFIDSWQKLQRMIGAIKLDEDLRKSFDGKVFVIIFQQTTTGRTKGGSEVVFDGDIIIKMKKQSSFSENYAFFDKNRYTKVPLEVLGYNIANQKVIDPQEQSSKELTTGVLEIG